MTVSKKKHTRTGFSVKTPQFVNINLKNFGFEQPSCILSNPDGMGMI